MTNMGRSDSYRHMPLVVALTRSEEVRLTAEAPWHEPRGLLQPLPSLDQHCGDEEVEDVLAAPNTGQLSLLAGDLQLFPVCLPREDRKMHMVAP